MGRRLLLMQWRHSAAWTAWCPASDTDTVEGFQYIRVGIFWARKFLPKLIETGINFHSMTGNSSYRTTFVNHIGRFFHVRFRWRFSG